VSRALSRTVVVLSSTVIAILAAEAVTRIIGVPPEFGRLMPIKGMPTRVVDGVVLWSPDDLRYDDDDIRRVSTDRSAFKIIGLGDSIMYGVGQPEEGTYLEQTRRVLAGRSTRPVEILNLAVPGYNTMQENAVYKEIEEQIKPDLVVVHYWGDDRARSEGLRRAGVALVGSSYHPTPRQTRSHRW
jgi:hypothetical protein